VRSKDSEILSILLILGSVQQTKTPEREIAPLFLKRRTDCVSVGVEHDTFKRTCCIGKVKENIMTSFKTAALNTPVEARTLNNMKALESSLNKNVDLFSKIGASRGKDIIPQWEAAYQEDADLAVRIALWARDVRGGAGERQLFRDILLHLEKQHKTVLTKTKLLVKVPDIGRWDDILIFTDPDVKSMAFDLIHVALRLGDGLCAKWMPRKGPLANELRNAFGWTPKFYRKRLVELTKVVETAMCAKKWDTINFEHVPSLAMSRYLTAFHKNAGQSFLDYKAKLVKGEAKVNAGAVYPYDIIKSLSHSGQNVVADKQWESLPDYMDGQNILPMVDVSGSMTAQINQNLSCLDVAVSLGLYCADKNKGEFKDLFLTFSAKPELLHLKGSLSEKMVQMSHSHWQMNTNLHAAFERILEVAVKNKVDQDAMPTALLILSDMQFDQCTKYDDSALRMIKRKYEAAGYSVPGIIFWHINAYANSPVQFDERGTALVSGFSPAIMKSVLKADFVNMTPVSIMKQTIEVARYDYH
jgi:hypothetical protein